MPIKTRRSNIIEFVYCRVREGRGEWLNPESKGSEDAGQAKKGNQDRRPSSGKES